MSLVTLTNSSSNLQTAGILGNLGNKVTNRSIRRDILTAHIPQVCTALILEKDEHGLRFCSSVLYGVTLMYKTKVAMIWNEAQSFISLITRKNNRSVNSIEDLHQTPQVKPRKTMHLLSDDPGFDIREEREIPFDDPEELIVTKKRKTELKRLDFNLFPLFLVHESNDNELTNIETSFEGYEETQQTVDLDLGFNFVEVPQEKPDQIDELLDFDLGDAANEQTTESGPVRTFEEDPFFHMSTNNDTTKQTKANNATKVFKVLVDSQIEFTEVELGLFHGRDKIATLRNNITEGEFHERSRFSGLLGRMLTTDGRNASILNSIIHEVELSRSLARLESTEHEVSRHAPPEPNDGLGESFDFDIDGNSRNEFVDEVFDISFGEVDISEGKSEHSFEEQTLDQDLVQYCSIPEHKLRKFHDFLMQEAQNCGSDLFPAAMPTDGHPESARKSVNFAVLIPNRLQEGSVGRGLAANAFASILALATRDEIDIQSCPSNDPHALLSGNDINIIVRV